MTTESNPSKSTATATNASNSQTAALRGAALAFGKPPVKPKPNLNTSASLNGALAAASKAGRASNPQSAPINNTGSQGEDARLRRQQSDGSSGNSSVGGGPSTPIRRISSQFPKSDASGHLTIPGGASADRSPGGHAR